MSLRWPILALVVSAVAWLFPLVLGAARGGPGSPGGPVWVSISYAVAGVALLVFIALLCAAIALRGRGS